MCFCLAVPFEEIFSIGNALFIVWNIKLVFKDMNQKTNIFRNRRIK